MFSRWGRFVYRRRRWVFLAALLIGFGMATFAGRAASELSAGGWLDPDSESQAVAVRLADDFGAGKGTLVLLYLGADGADATSPRLPGRRRKLGGRAEAVPAGRRDRRLRADRRRPLRQHQRRLRLRRGPAQRLGRGVRRAPRRAGGRHRAARRRDPAAARRLRPADPRLGRAVREGPHPRRDDLAADRRARADPGLRVAHRRGPAAPRRRARDPDHAGRRVLRRPGHGALDLRPERLDDARPRPRDRLLAVHGQPVPRGAGKGRTVGEAIEVTVATAGKAVAFSGFAVAVGLSGLLVFAAPALRSFGIGGAITVARLALLRPDVPARDPRDARAARRRAVDRRPRGLGPARPRPAVAPRGGRRRAIALGADRPRGDAPPRRRPRADARHPAHRRHPVLPPRPGHPGCLRAAGRAPEPRGGRRAPGRLPAGHDDTHRRPRRRRRLAHRRSPPSAPCTPSASSWPPSAASTPSRARSTGSGTRRPERR